MDHVTPAEAAIRETIAREGPITFCRFMDMALYSAPGSYYSSETERIGPRGDYFTSPELHPAFGALVARQAEQLWVAMGEPASFSLVEMGAGTGSLAADILSYTARWSPRFHQAISYTIVERSPAMELRQKQLLGGLGAVAERVAWHPAFAVEGWPHDDDGRQAADGASPSKLSIEGCFLSNELLDSFPVHRVVVMQGRLREIYVDIRDGRLVEVVDELSTPELSRYFERLGFMPPEGCRAEVNLAALRWLAGVARALRRGMVLTVDYGFSAEELYSDRHPDGTLLCFYRHTLNNAPYVRIGEQDMTSHLDFTSLANEGLSHGLATLGITTQRSFLLALGMGSYLEGLAGMKLRKRDYEANCLAMRELLRPEGLGRIKVLLQLKGLPGFDAAGLRPGGIRSEDLKRDLVGEPAPLLTPHHMSLLATPAAEPMMDIETMWDELLGKEET